jgi:hypothetical protein
MGNFEFATPVKLSDAGFCMAFQFPFFKLPLYKHWDTTCPHLNQFFLCHVVLLCATPWNLNCVLNFFFFFGPLLHTNFEISHSYLFHFGRRIESFEMPFYKTSSTKGCFFMLKRSHNSKRFEGPVLVRGYGGTAYRKMTKDSQRKIPQRFVMNPVKKKKQYRKLQINLVWKESFV